LQTAFRPVLSVRGANRVPTRRPNDDRTVLYAGSSRGSMRISCFSFVVYAERNVAIRIVFIRLFRIFVSNLTITRTLWQKSKEQSLSTRSAARGAGSVRQPARATCSRCRRRSTAKVIPLRGWSIPMPARAVPPAR